MNSEIYAPPTLCAPSNLALSYNNTIPFLAHAQTGVCPHQFYTRILLYEFRQIEKTVRSLLTAGLSQIQFSKYTNPVSNGSQPRSVICQSPITLLPFGPEEPSSPSPPPHGIQPKFPHPARILCPFLPITSQKASLTFLLTHPHKLPASTCCGIYRTASSLAQRLNPPISLIFQAAKSQWASFL